LNDYTAQYPLHKFSKWFITWAQENITSKPSLSRGTEISQTKKKQPLQQQQQQQQTPDSEIDKCDNGFPSKRKYIFQRTGLQDDGVNASTQEAQEPQSVVDKGITTKKRMKVKELKTESQLPKVYIAASIVVYNIKYRYSSIFIIFIFVATSS
jgi:hypothetical protein